MFGLHCKLSGNSSNLNNSSFTDFNLIFVLARDFLLCLILNINNTMFQTQKLFSQRNLVIVQPLATLVISFTPFPPIIFKIR